MSGDGTYIQYVSGGEGPPVAIPYPPLTENPHDPTHYYQGVDGRYYYSPDGSPHDEFGQPPVKKTIPPGQMPIDKPEMNDKWGHEASKGYHMTPEDLRTLATAMERDMGELQSVVNSNRADMAATGAVGKDDWPAAHDFTKLASKAQNDFGEFYSLLITTYQDVIRRLRTTANNGEKGEHDTHKAVTAQQTSTSSGTPSTGSRNRAV
jgi:hypothetical protein